MNGTVSKLFAKKGFGFILSDDGHELFFHRSDLKGIEFRAIEKGMRVKFESEEGPKGFRASQVMRGNAPVISDKMLKVTSSAKEKLQATIKKRTDDPDMAIRIQPYPDMPNRLEFGFDRERIGDQIVQTNDGVKVLLIGPDVMPVIKGKMIDYNTDEPGFTISNLSQGS